MTCAAKLRCPVVLVPGILGFDELCVGGFLRVQYFRHIPQLLTAAGNRVLVARLRPLAGIAERASQLRAMLDQHFPGEPVHLISHSLGGLDCRYLISRLGMAGRVRSLTTVGTPHRGTSFADWGVRRFERVLRPLLERLRLPHQAFYDLTTDRCRRLNDEAPDVPHVRYFYIAGWHESSWRTPVWSLSQKIVGEAEGPNDGVVSIASATWGEPVGVWNCDHFGLINWPNRVLRACGTWKDRTSDYAALTHNLAAAEC